jgi:hypothetical protein
MCEFMAKSKSGLHLHLKAKHKECSQNDSEISEIQTHLEPDDVVVNEEPVYIQEHNCEQCEFVANAQTDLETYEIEKQGTCEIKLEVFLLFLNFDNDVLEVRKQLIEKLEEQDEDEKSSESLCEKYFSKMLVVGHFFRLLW